MPKMLRDVDERYQKIYDAIPMQRRLDIMAHSMVAEDFPDGAYFGYMMEECGFDIDEIQAVLCEAPEESEQ